MWTAANAADIKFLQNGTLLQIYKFADDFINFVCCERLENAERVQMAGFVLRSSVGA